LFIKKDICAFTKKIYIYIYGPPTIVLGTATKKKDSDIQTKKIGGSKGIYY
jgi:hypothetical protein